MKKEIYRRNLPHFHIKGQTFFITWMLYGALPRDVILNSERNAENESILKYNSGYHSNQMKKDFIRKKFIDFDENLDLSHSDNHILRIPDIAQIVKESLHFWDRKKIDLICYCIMSNHVHTIFTTKEKDLDENEVYLQDILESIKKFSAKRCNLHLKQTGQFWQHESFDRIIKDREDLYWTINYILDNPIKAGYCENRKDYKWSYIQDQYKDLFDTIGEQLS